MCYQGWADVRPHQNYGKAMRCECGRTECAVRLSQRNSEPARPPSARLRKPSQNGSSSGRNWYLRSQEATLNPDTLNPGSCSGSCSTDAHHVPPMPRMKRREEHFDYCLLKQVAGRWHRLLQPMERLTECTWPH